MPDLRFCFTVWFALQAPGLCQAQPAPGEDPMVLNQRLQRTMVPLQTGVQPVQSSIQELPAWMDAKLARFQAKAFATDTSGVLTDEDVITRTTREGVRKVCVQDIASNSTANTGSGAQRFGPKPDAQIVVLRGDLVNICR